jgi:hypothetical protein
VEVETGGSAENEPASLPGVPRGVGEERLEIDDPRMYDDAGRTRVHGDRHRLETEVVAEHDPGIGDPEIPTRDLPEIELPGSSSAMATETALESAESPENAMGDERPDRDPGRAADVDSEHNAVALDRARRLDVILDRHRPTDEGRPDARRAGGDQQPDAHDAERARSEDESGGCHPEPQAQRAP